MLLRAIKGPGTCYLIPLFVYECVCVCVWLADMCPSTKAFHGWLRFLSSRSGSRTTMFLALVIVCSGRLCDERACQSPKNANIIIGNFIQFTGSSNMHQHGNVHYVVFGVLSPKTSSSWPFLRVQTSNSLWLANLEYESCPWLKYGQYKTTLE